MHHLKQAESGARAFWLESININVVMITNHRAYPSQPLVSCFILFAFNPNLRLHVFPFLTHQTISKPYPDFVLKPLWLSMQFLYEMLLPLRLLLGFCILCNTLFVHEHLELAYLLPLRGSRVSCVSGSSVFSTI